MRNNLSLVNVLCYMALELPLEDQPKILAKYIGILQNLFEKIYESTSALDSQTQLCK